MSFASIEEAQRAKQQALAEAQRNYAQQERAQGKSRAQHQQDLNRIEQNYNQAIGRLSRAQQQQRANEELRRSNASPAAKAQAQKNWNPTSFNRTSITELAARYDAKYKSQAEGARLSSAKTAQSDAVKFNENLQKTVIDLDKDKDKFGIKITPLGQSSSFVTKPDTITVATKKKPQVYPSSFFRDSPDYVAPKGIEGTNQLQSDRAVLTFQETQQQQKELFAAVTSASSGKEAIKARDEFQSKNPYVGIRNDLIYKGGTIESRGVLIEKKLVSPKQETMVNAPTPLSKQISPLLVSEPKPIETKPKQEFQGAQRPVYYIPPTKLTNTQSGAASDFFEEQYLFKGFTAHSTELIESVKSVFNQGKQYEPTLEGAFVSDVINRGKNTFLGGQEPITNTRELLEKKQKEKGGYEWLAGSIIGTGVIGVAVGGIGTGAKLLKPTVKVAGQTVEKATAKEAVKIGSKLAGTVEEDISIPVLLGRKSRPSRFGESTQVLREEPTITVKTKEPVGIEPLGRDKVLISVGKEDTSKPFIVYSKKKSTIYDTSTKQPVVESSYEITGKQSTLLEKGKTISQKKLTRPETIETVTSKSDPTKRTFTRKETTVIQTKTYPATQKNIEQVGFARDKELAQFGTKKTVLSKDLSRYPRQVVASVTQRPTAKTTLLETKITNVTKDVARQASKTEVRELGAESRSKSIITPTNKKTNPIDSTPTNKPQSTVLQKRPSQTKSNEKLRQTIRVQETRTTPFSGYAILGVGVVASLRPSLSAKQSLATKDPLQRPPVQSETITRTNPPVKNPLLGSSKNKDPFETKPLFSLRVYSGNEQKLETPVTLKTKQSLVPAPPMRIPPRRPPVRRPTVFVPSFDFGRNSNDLLGKRKKPRKNKNFLGNAPIEEFSGLYNRDEIIYTKGRKKSKKTGIKFKPSKLKLF